MNFVRSIKSKLAGSKLISKIKSVKNIEIVIAVILAIFAAVAFFAVSAKTAQNDAAPTSVASVQMNESEARLAEMISEISGVGRSRVLITCGDDKQVIGVVVVAEGAESMDNRIKMIRCVEKATGATVDEIEIFAMQKGG